MTPEQLEAHRAYERESQRRKYLKDGGRERKQAERARRLQAKLAVYRELKSAPCVDCGGTFDQECMDFDHVSDKTENVSVLVYRDVSLAKLKAEIAKCELVCSNCHRVRTKMRRAA